MGKLAERYSDATRSGVYRVADASVPRAAAEEAEALLLETSAAGLADGGGDRLRHALAESSRRACVVLVGDAPSFAAQRSADYALLLVTLDSAARSRVAAGRPFFAVMVDPRSALPLPPLYKER